MTTVYLESTFPPIDLPKASIWDFIFSRSTSHDQIVYVDETTGEEISFGQLKMLTKRLAFALRYRIGLDTSPGANVTVVLFAGNSIFYAAALLAINAAGFCVSPANAAFGKSDLVYQIRDSGATVVIAGHEMLDIASAACQQTGVDKLFVLDWQSEVHPTIWSFIDSMEFTPEPMSPEECCATPVLLCYSSGTSGRPKGVKTSSFNISSAILQSMTHAPSSFTDKEVWIASLPMSHMYGLFCTVYMALYIGVKTVVMKRFSIDRYCAAAEKFKATVGHIVPPIAVLLVKSTDVGVMKLPSLKEWRSAAAPLGHDLAKSLETQWGVPIESLYAMTETTAVITMTHADDPVRMPGCVGRLSPNVTAKIVNGELRVKGPNIMLGYYNRPESDAEAFDEEGYMRTGDVVRVDENGFFFVVDRVKELIKYKGFQVPPAELEDLLLKHEDVADAAVIGVEDKAQATELPRAFVVLTKAAKESDPVEMKAKLLGYVSSRVAYYKKIRGGIVFVESIPKSPAGKILRRNLRDLRDIVYT